ncbi:Cannabidiolic acid synthase-like [Seminavis robusta]|uniref:Cannabidiolic acid synthase-like n=1 Tax=Seminavis robusta TaxID=568900 RepID=A0A9N8HAI1_9STRA|nr:Cannabidiolic acid synthase-like [Seminavis robusta]|eukprot:Sro243_g096780.1 Cannabidiolic acid synthase-like (550) ;mRNA; r:16852-18501
MPRVRLFVSALYWLLVAWAPVCQSWRLFPAIRFRGGGFRMTSGNGGGASSSWTKSAASITKILKELDFLNTKIDGSVIVVGHDNLGKDTLLSDLYDKEGGLTWMKPTPVPLAIVQVASESDVAVAVPILVRLQKDFGIPFRIRSGGHHYNGYSSVEMGIVLDIGTNLNKITLCHNNNGSEEEPLAWIEPGVNGGDIWKQLIQKHKLAAIMGGCPAVNQGGFLLGGGFSYWSRLYGLGCDRMVAARVVLANGTIVTANATNSHCDLFWALRGAGSAGPIGGVVTSFQIRLFPTQDEQVYGMGKIPSVEEAAHYLTNIGTRTNLPGNAGITLFLFPKQFYGDEWLSVYNWYDNGIPQLQTGMTLLNATFRDALLHPDTARGFGMEIQSGTEHSKMGLMEGRLWQVWNGFLMPEQCNTQTWTKLLTIMREMRDACEGYVTIEVLLWGGAISDVSPSETAFFWRRGIYNICVNLGVPAHVENAEIIFERHRAYLSRAWPKVNKYLQGAYYNYPVQGRKEGNSDVYFGGNVAKLRKIKKQYDPDNVFYHPQSIV